jgi:hypothetical protein
MKANKKQKMYSLKQLRTGTRQVVWINIDESRPTRESFDSRRISLSNDVIYTEARGLFIKRPHLNLVQTKRKTIDDFNGYGQFSLFFSNKIKLAFETVAPGSCQFLECDTTGFEKSGLLPFWHCIPNYEIKNSFDLDSSNVTVSTLPYGAVIYRYRWKHSLNFDEDVISAYPIFYASEFFGELFVREDVVKELRSKKVNGISYFPLSMK